jgi:O-antigen biosynthesis protein WbqP
MLSTRQKIYLVFKRAIDIFGSVLGILLLSPLLILCTIIGIFVSKGHPFFVQPRLGKHKKPFNMIKFRSMRIDAPQIPPADMTIEEQQKLVTPWGKFIRKTSIDEIPQLFNIFAGSMSFIGPRPSQTEEHEADLVAARESYVPSAYEVKPGLSGYAQIHMKREHDINEKAMLDSLYVQKLSFWFDTKIFVYSFFAAFGIVKGR